MQKNNRIVLGSYNIRIDIPIDGEDVWENRKSEVAQLITKYGFDVLGIQEVRMSQYEDLSKLTNYKLVGEPRTNGEHAEYNPIMYNVKKVELLESATFWLSETPEVVSKYMGADCERICRWGIFKVKKTAEKFLFLNTHLDHISIDARVYGIKVILDFIKTKQWEEPIILVGDFNALANEECFTFLTKEGFVNARSNTGETVKGPIGTCTTITFDHNLPLDEYKQIDYIFVKPTVDILSFVTITDKNNGKYPSDHLPILVEVVI